MALARSLSALLRWKPTSTTTLSFSSSLSVCLRRSITTTTATIPSLSRRPTTTSFSPPLRSRSFATTYSVSRESSYDLETGCDFEHWLVVTDTPPEDASREHIIDSYVKTLAEVLGSEEEARMKIYSVSTKCYFAFGALLSEELSHKLKELPNVRWVLPDSYTDVENKDYGGEPFIQGQAVPYDPKYHENWTNGNLKSNDYKFKKNFNGSKSTYSRRRRTVNADRHNKGGMTNKPDGQYGGRLVDEDVRGRDALSVDASVDNCEFPGA